MSYARRQVKRDKNHVEVIDEMRRCGVWVDEIFEPLDTLCSYQGYIALVEIKVSDKTEQFTKKQIEYIATAPFPVIIAKSGAEAVEALKNRSQVTTDQKRRLLAMLLRTPKDKYTSLDIRKILDFPKGSPADV